MAQFEKDDLVFIVKDPRERFPDVPPGTIARIVSVYDYEGTTVHDLAMYVRFKGGTVESIGRVEAEFFRLATEAEIEAYRAAPPGFADVATALQTVLADYGALIDEIKAGESPEVSLGALMRRTNAHNLIAKLYQAGIL